MGIAAYNRGSAAISRGIQMDHGTWREPAQPTPRPAGWGDKIKARALDHAERMLRANQKLVAKLGADAWKPITLEILAGAVEMKARCSSATATEAARLAMGETSAMRIAEPPDPPTRHRIGPVEPSATEEQEDDGEQWQGKTDRATLRS